LDELSESDSPVSAETVRCQKHEDEVIKLYCKTCQETICRDCTIVDHRQHDYVFARDVSQEKKDELLCLVGKVKQKRSETAESLEYLKKLEEIVNGSNESCTRLKK
jgi:transcription initiation factor IIF auxiliary subunit